MVVGLDSHAAMCLLEHVQGLARRGCTVLTAIHQPNPLMWELFDELVLLAEGFTLFCGAPSKVKAKLRLEIVLLSLERALQL